MLIRKLPHTRRRRGFNLIEAAIVLGVVGLVIGGIWIAAAAIQNKRQTNQIVQTVGVLHSNVQKLFKNHRATLFVNHLTKSFMETVAPPGTTAKLYGGMWGITDEFGNYYVLMAIQPSSIDILVLISTEQCVAVAPRLASTLNSYLNAPVYNGSLTDISTPASAAEYCDADGIHIHLSP